MEDNGFGRSFMIIITVIAVGGFVLYFLGVLNLPFGNLPGDINIDTPWFSIELPLGTALLVGVLITLLLDLILRLMKK
jgi:hypothetical protein